MKEKSENPSDFSILSNIHIFILTIIIYSNNFVVAITNEAFYNGAKGIELKTVL